MPGDSNWFGVLRGSYSYGAVLESNHDLERLALVHRSVSVGHAVEVRDPIEDPARLNPAFEHVGQQFLDVGPDRNRAAGNALRLQVALTRVRSAP